jgi:hypothetical protein
MSDSFLGAWHVTETVFNPDDSYAGFVRQRRELFRLANGNLRVVQECAVSAELQTHTMGGFQGKWIFDLCVDGKNRHYLGADVVGTGIQYVDGIMTGRGHWPRFGHSFVSFSFLQHAERQITGGIFHDNGTPIAKIVGIAIPANAVWPDIVELREVEMSKDCFQSIVGAATYQVWVDMLQKVVSEGRTHNLAPLVAGMLQYAYQVALETDTVEDDVADAFVNEIDEPFQIAGIPKPIWQATRQLFQEAGVHASHRSAHGDSTSVMEDAFEEFIHWHDYSWER